MMKAFLSLSLVLNLVLGYFLFFRKPEREVVERLVIETHAEKVKETPAAPVPVTNVPKTEEEKKKKDSPVVTVHDSHEIQEAGEKMESDRVEFMSTELGMSEDKIAQHNKIRDEFFKKTAEFWQKNPMRELNFKERRQMIELEEEVHRKLEKLHGKKNWERYQKFRESYNQKGFKKQMEDGQPFLFMGL